MVETNFEAKKGMRHFGKSWIIKSSYTFLFMIVPGVFQIELHD